MTLMCLDRSQSPTHKGAFLQGRKSPENNNINNHNNANNRRNSCSPPLSKNQPDVPHAIKSLNLDQSRKLERSASEPAEKQQRGVQNNSSRYKTELCRPFEENGTCKYGDKCQFAHGIKELRSMARHPKYKTELCRTFHSTGLCPYGPRCHFIHNSEQSKKNLLTNLTGPGTTAAVTRPKALTSLGSAGDISPPSSNEGSPTGVKTFEFQQNGSSSHNPIQFSADFVKQVSMLSSMNHLNDFSVRDYCSDFMDSVSVFNDLSPPDYVDNYSFHVNSLYPIPLTPSSPAENNIFRHPLFDRY